MPCPAGIGDVGAGYPPVGVAVLRGPAPVRICCAGVGSVVWGVTVGAYRFSGDFCVNRVSETVIGVVVAESVACD